MVIQNIIEQLHPNIVLETQYSDTSTNPTQLDEYEALLKIKIPQWYLSFLETFGYIQCIIGEGSSFFLFYINESKGYYQDHYDEKYDDLDFRILIGTDLGDRALFHSERDGEPGIYVSYGIPDAEYFVFLAPNLENFLFNGIGLEKFAKM